MKHRRIPHLAGIVALACATALFAGSGALQKGQKVWSKHHETGLLAEPSPLAGAQATVGFAEKLKILEVRGAWLRVRGDGDEGWVFEGNVAADKPQLPPATALTMVDAAQTDTVAAARPWLRLPRTMRPGTTRAAQADIDWIDAEAARLPADEVLAYMSANRRGEYRE